MILSTIDIGTNTILMVTMNAHGGAVRVLGDEHAIARLGRGVDSSRAIQPDAFDRVATHLQRYSAIAAGLGANRVVAYGTSALRDASNREQFIAEMALRTGIGIEVISGDDEARLTYRGALFGIATEGGEFGVLDIGGGSTEVALGAGGTLRHGASVDIGAVRITERYLKQLPADAEAVANARDAAEEILRAAPAIPAGTTVVGVAGTVTSLGAIALGMRAFNADALNGTRLSASAIADITARLTAMSLEHILELPGVHPDRADILPGGAMILDAFMRLNALETITVSTRGVRYGMALAELERCGHDLLHL